jgi:RNA polymerase-binding transcription factor DksA
VHEAAKDKNRILDQANQRNSTSASTDEEEEGESGDVSKAASGEAGRIDQAAVRATFTDCGGRASDDEGAFALQDVIKELAATNLEREIRTLTEVELSLRLLESGQYGLCGSCGDEIPTARLQALPWTRICVACAGGAIKGAERENGDAAKEHDLPAGVLRFQKRAGR